MKVPKIDLPIFTTTRPSTGEKVDVRPYTTKEEKILMLAAAGKDQAQIAKAVQQVISNCVLTPMKGSLSAIDVEWFFIYLRTISVSDIVELSLKTPDCETEKCPKAMDAIMDLKEAKVGNKIDGKFVEFKGTKKNSTHKVMINSEVGIELKYPSAEIISLYKDESDQWDMEKQERLVYDCVVCLFDAQTIYEKEKDFDFDFFVEKFYNNMSSKSKAAVGDYINSMPTTFCEVKAYCKICKKSEKRMVNGITSFFDLSMVTNEP